MSQQRGAGTAHDDRGAHPQQFAAALFHSRSERKKVAVSINQVIELEGGKVSK